MPLEDAATDYNEVHPGTLLAAVVQPSSNRQTGYLRVRCAVCKIISECSVTSFKEISQLKRLSFLRHFNVKFPVHTETLEHTTFRFAAAYGEIPREHSAHAARVLEIVPPVSLSGRKHHTTPAGDLCKLLENP